MEPQKEEHFEFIKQYWIAKRAGEWATSLGQMRREPFSQRGIVRGLRILTWKILGHLKLSKLAYPRCPAPHCRGAARWPPLQSDYGRLSALLTGSSGRVLD